MIFVESMIDYAVCLLGMAHEGSMWLFSNYYDAQVTTICRMLEVLVDYAIGKGSE